MRERRDILEAFDQLCRAGTPAVLASVVGTEGSTYRRAGARVLIPPDGDPVGLISGGCLEDDVAERAREVLATGRPRRMRYDSRDDQDRLFGLGLGCRGVVDLLLERVDAESPGPLGLEARCSRERLPCALATVVRDPDQASLGQRWLRPGASAAREPRAVAAALDRVLGGGAIERVEQDGIEVLVEPVLPSLRVLVLGAGPDAPALVSLCETLGWVSRVWDVRPAYAKPERFPTAERVVCCEVERAAEDLPLDAWTAAVVMTHHYERDRALLAWLLDARACYIAALGPRARTQEMLDDLGRDGHDTSPPALAALHAPAGLDLGAESAPAVALAIASEIQACFAGRAGGPLRERQGSIHEAGT